MTLTLIDLIAAVDDGATSVKKKAVNETKLKNKPPKLFMFAHSACTCKTMVSALNTHTFFLAHVYV